MRLPLPVGRGTPYLSNGWQSWSTAAEAHLGGRVIRTGPADRAHHPIAEPPYDGDECYDVLAADGFVAGFATGGGVLVARPDRGDLLAVREGRGPHPPVLWAEGDRASLVGALLDRVGGRVPATTPPGWCTWYCRYADISEETVDADLRGATELADAIDVFQVDDNFQAAVGDWQLTNGSFSNGLAAMADKIAQAGFRPGLWTAPFLLSPSSRLAGEHPDWFVRRPNGRRVAAAANRHWDGLVYSLDTSRPDVLDWLEGLYSHLVALGFTYLKLDFLYAAALEGVRSRPVSGADALRLGLEAIRRGAGDDAFLLGCGCPLWPAIGVVDGMRVGPDVAPCWDPPSGSATEPSLANARRNAGARSFMHGRLWANDPDCVMLRRRHTALTPEQSRRWARWVADSGQMLILSDRFDHLDADDRALWRDLVAAR